MTGPRTMKALTCVLVWLLVGVAHGSTPGEDWEELREAVRDGDVSAVERILGSGVDVNQQDGAGWTVLHWWNFSRDFGEKSFLGTLRLLVKRGVKVNSVDARGRTALMLLLSPRGDDQPRTPQLEAIQILVNAGSDLRLRNEWGESAVSLGLTSESEEVRAYFRELGKAPPGR